jgi:hypothetical protein
MEQSTGSGWQGLLVARMADQECPGVHCMASLTALLATLSCCGCVWCSTLSCHDFCIIKGCLCTVADGHQRMDWM